MSNLNLCAVNRDTGWCGRCGIFVGQNVCAELQSEYDKYDADTGEYLYDDSNPLESFDEWQ